MMKLNIFLEYPRDQHWVSGLLALGISKNLAAVFFVFARGLLSSVDTDDTDS